MFVAVGRRNGPPLGHTGHVGAIDGNVIAAAPKGFAPLLLLFRVEAAQTRLLSAIETTGDPFAIYDARERLVIWNPAFEDQVGAGENSLWKGMPRRDLARMYVENGKIVRLESDDRAYEVHIHAKGSDSGRIRGKIFTRLRQGLGHDFQDF